MPYCEKCGNKLSENDNFCDICGKKQLPPLSASQNFDREIPQVNNSKGNKAGIIIGICGGATAFVAVIALLCVIFIPKLFKEEDTPPSYNMVIASTEQEETQKPTQEITEPPTQAPTKKTPAVTEETDFYLLPDSDSKYLTESDLATLAEDELELARNEIFARHGRKFNDTELQEYFNKQSWYNGTVSPSSFDTGVLNKYETYNVDFILEYEKGIDDDTPKSTDNGRVYFDDFSMVVPSSWVYVENDDSVTFYEPYNKNSGYGGRVCSVMVQEGKSDSYMYPRYEILGSYDGDTYIVLYPTDVQYNFESDYASELYADAESKTAEALNTIIFD